MHQNRRTIISPKDKKLTLVTISYTAPKRSQSQIQSTPFTYVKLNINIVSRCFIWKGYFKRGWGCCQRAMTINTASILRVKLKEFFLLWRGINKTRANWIWGNGVKRVANWIIYWVMFYPGASLFSGRDPSPRVVYWLRPIVGQSSGSRNWKRNLAKV